MMAPLIAESGVEFGPFEEERLFRIEHSEVHKRAGKGIKAVEFVYLTKKANLLFVEAKTSCPNPENRDKDSDMRKKYEETYSEITDKFIDSLHMFAAMALGRYGEKPGAGQLIRRTYSEIGIKFVLVITGAKEEWLMGPKAELEARLLRVRNIWKADVIVLNKDMATRYGLIRDGE
ncbi:MAG: hypothetical protein Q4F41_10065 [Eubacteriales bacterium]|nr:hypothetical protein [Eubacteriales bacterium]